jgi:hypothetical protein
MVGGKEIKEMRMQPSILRGTKVAMVGGLALAAGFLATRAKADDWDKKTILTVKEPIQITDTYLQPGTYVLMLDRYSQSDRHIVRIYNDQQNHLINTVLAMPAYRVRVTGNTQFTFWETSPGSARALRDWFWPGDNFGQEFAYPKNLKQVAQVSSAKTTAAAGDQAASQAQAQQSQTQPEQQPQVQAQAPEQAAPQAQAQAEQQPAPQSQAEAPEQAAQQAPAPDQAAQQAPAEVQEDVIIIAQATPQSQPQPSYQGQANQGQGNPAPGQTNQADTNQGQANQGQVNQGQSNQGATNEGQANQGQTQSSHTQSQPQQLPQTASQYPMVGLIGLFSLGLYGLLRAKRTA